MLVDFILYWQWHFGFGSVWKTVFSWSCWHSHGMMLLWRKNNFILRLLKVAMKSQKKYLLMLQLNMLKTHKEIAAKGYILTVLEVKCFCFTAIRCFCSPVTSRHLFCTIESNFSWSLPWLLSSDFPEICCSVYPPLFFPISLCYSFQMLKSVTVNFPHWYLLPSLASSLLKFSWKAVHQCP